MEVMKPFLVVLAAIIVLIGFFLAMFAQPIGWIIVAAGMISLFIALLKRDIGARRLLVHHAHRHGPEDRRRGPNDDAMLH